MDVMNSPVKTLEELLKQATLDYPLVRFKSADAFMWSDQEKTVYYNAEIDHPMWSLLHELGHMQHGHDTYSSDTALIKLEMEAWAAAVTLGEHYGVAIDDEHIQDCMDSYRRWRQNRSRCPQCSLTGVELRGGLYRCINCRSEWTVGEDRFCRVYRRKTMSI